MHLLPDSEPAFSLRMSQPRRSYLGWQQLAYVDSNRLLAVNHANREHSHLWRETMEAMGEVGHELIAMCAACPLAGEHHVEGQESFRTLHCRGFEYLIQHSRIIDIPAIVLPSALISSYRRDSDAEDPVPEHLLALPAVNDNTAGTCGLAVSQMFEMMPAE